ncbi:alkyl sulfatase C-terminal domain-containing protein [Mycobacterium kansasii]
MLGGANATDLVQAGKLRIVGPSDPLEALRSVTDKPDPGFSIVTP